MTKHFCDICGKEIDLKNSSREIFHFPVYESLYDICNCGEVIYKTPKVLQSKGYIICDDKVHNLAFYMSLNEMIEENKILQY